MIVMLKELISIDSCDLSAYWNMRWREISKSLLRSTCTCRIPGLRMPLKLDFADILRKTSLWTIPQIIPAEYNTTKDDHLKSKRNF